MSTRALSASTLSLRFMQNAHRAMNLAQVEVEKAPVKDDAEWEVAQEVRDAWGLSRLEASSSSTTVVYEASYLPFLFPSTSEERQPVEDTNEGLPPPRTIFKGRRVFGEYGKETNDQPTSSSTATIPQKDDAEIEEGEVPQESQDLTSPKWKSQRADRRDNREMKPGSSRSQALSKDTRKTAREAIGDISGVGTDLRPPRPILTPNAFLKPAVFDTPPTEEGSTREDGGPGEADSVSTKKREREEIKESKQEGKKRKKKKKESE